MPQLDDSLYKWEALLAADLTRPEAYCMPFFEREGRLGRESRSR